MEGKRREVRRGRGILRNRERGGGGWEEEREGGGRGNAKSGWRDGWRGQTIDYRTRGGGEHRSIESTIEGARENNFLCILISLVRIYKQNS